MTFIDLFHVCPHRSAAFLLSALLRPLVMAGEHQWTLLSSGDGVDTHERWQVNGTRLRTLPALTRRAEPPLSVHQATAAALAHAHLRHPSDDFVVTEVSLRRFSTEGAVPQGEDAARGWVTWSALPTTPGLVRDGAGAAGWQHRAERQRANVGTGPYAGTSTCARIRTGMDSPLAC
jgi:hypothetical protein